MRTPPPSSLAFGVGLLLTAAVAGCGVPSSATFSASGGGGGGGTKRIIILTNGNSPFWDAARAGLQDAAKKLELDKAGLMAVVEGMQPQRPGAPAPCEQHRLADITLDHRRPRIGLARERDQGKQAEQQEWTHATSLATILRAVVAAGLFHSVEQR